MSYRYALDTRDSTTDVHHVKLIHHPLEANEADDGASNAANSLIGHSPDQASKFNRFAGAIAITQNLGVTHPGSDWVDTLHI